MDTEFTVAIDLGAVGPVTAALSKAREAIDALLAAVDNHDAVQLLAVVKALREYYAALPAASEVLERAIHGLNIEHREHETVIEGTRYSNDLLRALGQDGHARGPFVIEGREGGTLTLRSIDRWPEPASALPPETPA